MQLDVAAQNENARRRETTHVKDLLQEVWRLPSLIPTAVNCGELCSFSHAFLLYTDAVYWKQSVVLVAYCQA